MSSWREISQIVGMPAARTVSGTVYCSDLSQEHEAAGPRGSAATTQLGPLLGLLVGGVALVDGFDALALAYGGLFLAATASRLRVRHARRAQRLAIGR